MTGAADHRINGRPVVASFATTLEAEVTAAALRGQGLDPEVVADDCAGLRPELHPLLGVHVVVAPGAADAAVAFLAQHAPAGGRKATVRPSFRARHPVFWTAALGGVLLCAAGLVVFLFGVLR